MTLQEAFERLLERNLKPRTRLDYQDLYEKYWKGLGNRPVRSITALEITEILDRVPGNRTRAQVWALGHRLFRLARAQGSFQLLDRPRYQAPKPQIWTRAELERFIEGSQDHPYGPLYRLAVASGLRLAQLLALDWREVDLGAGTLRVSRTVQRRKGTWVWSEPKTQAGFRTVALPELGVRALLERGPKAQGLVLGDTEPWDPTKIAKELRPLCLKLGIRPLTMHQLRHLHASLLLGKGVPVTLVSAQLGHASPEITLRVYAHLIPGSDQVRRALDGTLTVT